MVYKQFLPKPTATELQKNLQIKGIRRKVGIPKCTSPITRSIEAETSPLRGDQRRKKNPNAHDGRVEAKRREGRYKHTK